MELRAGYKQTEVGVIPEDWVLEKVGNLATKVASGRSHVDSKLGEYPVHGSTGIIGFSVHNEYSGRAILVARVGANAGKLCIVEGEYGVTDNTIMVKTACSVNMDYFWRQLEAKRLNSMVFGSGQPLITGTQIKGLFIPLPPTKAEQEAIAGALSDADGLIESLEQLIAKKRHLKQGAMQQLLRPKEDWENKRLGQTATLKARIGWQGLTTAEYLDSGDYHLVTGTDFKNGYIDWDNCHCVEESRYVQDRNIQLKVSDVLVTKDGTIGKVALVDRLEKPATLNSGVFVIRPLDGAFDPVFFYYLLCSKVFKEFLNQLSAGSTINHLYQKDFVNFTYSTPSTLAEQTAIAAVLSDMDGEIEALETKLGKARQLKAGMMHNLLTGKIRLI